MKGTVTLIFAVVVGVIVAGAVLWSEIETNGGEAAKLLHGIALRCEVVAQESRDGPLREVFRVPIAHDLGELDVIELHADH